MEANSSKFVPGHPAKNQGSYKAQNPYLFIYLFLQQTHCLAYYHFFSTNS